MTRTDIGEPVELHGKSTTLQDRISFVTTLLNGAESKVNHFDGLRQRNLMVAIAIFSGLASFVVKASGLVIAISISACLCVVMAMFFILDRRFRMYSHGWQATGTNMKHVIARMLNDHEVDVPFPLYDVTGETRPGRFPSMISRIYIILLVGAPLSVLAYWVPRAP